MTVSPTANQAAHPKVDRQQRGIVGAGPDQIQSEYVKLRDVR